MLSSVLSRGSVAARAVATRAIATRPASPAVAAVATPAARRTVATAARATPASARGRVTAAAGVLSAAVLSTGTAACFFGSESKTAHTASKALGAGSVALPKPKVVFVLGGPGAGKGTMCSRIVEDYGWVHLSAGDLLRAERDSGSKDGDMISAYIKEGKIVPVEVTVKLLKNAMVKSGKSNFLIDGFPRNFDNVQGWEKVVGDSVDVVSVLFFDTSEGVMESRLLERGKTSGRSDDNLVSIRKRFKTYLESTMPVVDHFAKKGIVRRVCSSAEKDEVYVDTKRVVDQLVSDSVLEANQTLLDAIAAGDTDAYKALVADDVTCFENESRGQLVQGHAFHDFYLNQAKAAKASSGGSSGKGYAGASQSTFSNPVVRVLGDSAVVSYIRLVQTKSDTQAFAETRVWSSRGGRWQNVHFHRSSVGDDSIKKVLG